MVDLFDPTEPWEPLYERLVELDNFPVILGPQWAPGASKHQRHIGPAILCVLGPQWAVGATIWTRGKSMSLQVFWVSSEPQEPLYEPHACLAISRYSASPVSHRSHYMNLVYSYLYTGILDPQLPHIPIYHHHVHLAIPTLSGSPVSHRSH